MIPELVSFIEYRKGPFYSEIGDFSGAGAANVHLASSLPQGTLNLQGGTYGFVRGLVAESPTVGPGTLLYALEYNRYNGPWVIPEGSNRYNGFLRYHWTTSKDQYALSASLYAAPDWHASDHVAQRAIDNGLITRFGTLDPSDGGNTGRGALTFHWTRKHDDGQTTLTMYGFYYRLNLYSNFTYYLLDQTNGDQFEQIDRRYVGGANLRRAWNQIWLGKDVENVLGVQIRNDYLPLSGLDHAANRHVMGVYIDDRIEEFTAGAYGNNQIQWSDWFRTNVGVRADVFAVDVSSNIPVNSGSKTDAIVSPKASLIFGPWKKTELYFNLGSGFHSNDARGVTATDLAPQSKVPLLVRTKGAEVGTRTSILPGLVSTLSLWYLQSDSELIFSGDAGDTEATSQSHKYGVEWANFYKPTSWLTLVADVALTHARYVDEHKGDYVGPYIPNSIPIVVSGVATVETPIGIFASTRLRYFSSQPLIEDNSVREPDSLIIDAKVGYHRGRYEVAADVLNLLNSKSDDIAYYYPSQLRNETSSVPDVHIHPVEPFEVRAGLTVHY
jgi:NAD(P)H-hydrate repair Nnr-like enzyme with NAD(P)H-hydrate epimerase domain